MLYQIIFVLGSVFSVSAALATFNKSATSTVVIPVPYDRDTKMWTFTGTPVVLQTPTPTAIVVGKHAGNLTANVAQVASQPFNTNCCGFAGVYGWTASGSSIATMNGVCFSVPSSLDLNTCLGWDPSKGVGCPNTGHPKGGFLSAQSGCKVAGAPNVLPIGSVSGGNTFIYVICNGAQPGVLLATALDLRLCVGITSDGHLACYN